MTTRAVIFKILFVILIAHSCLAQAAPGPEQVAAGRRGQPSTSSELAGRRRRSTQELRADPSVPVAAADPDEQPVDQQVPRAGSTPATTTLLSLPNDERAELLAAPAEPRPAPLEPGNGAAIDRERPLATTSRPPERTRPAPGQASSHLADLCYLSNGGSSLTLTVNEATPVGTTVGQVEVNGDPSLDSAGNIDLLDGAQLLQMQQQQPWSAEQQQQPQPQPQQASEPGTGAPRPLAARRSLSRRSQASLSQQLGPQAPLYSIVATASSQRAAAAGSAQPPIRLEPGTRNLVLARPLDKESQEAETSLLVQVKCRPRLPIVARPAQPKAGAGTELLSFTTIPIRILITDANDHAPEFLGPQPYVINVSETAPIGHIVSRNDMQALDRDHSTGPHSTINYRVVQAGQSRWMINASGSAPTEADRPPRWQPSEELDEASGAQMASAELDQHLASLFTFANPLEPILSVARPLDYESLPSSFVLTIEARDQGEPEPLASQAQVQINLMDSDDQNPKFLEEKYSLLMDEAQVGLVGQSLRILPNGLRAIDGDRGINAPILYSFDHLSAAGPGSSANPRESDRPTGEGQPAELDRSVDHFLHLNPSSGELRLIRQWPINDWTMNPMTLVLRATQADNRDRYALTTLTIITTTTMRPTSGANLSHQALGREGIAFNHTDKRLVVEVAEDSAAGERIATVRALHLNSSGAAWDGSDGSARGDVNLQEQQVDLVPNWPNKPILGATNNKTRPRLKQANIGHRPINYQILDDQLDQFSINGQGEIQLKRSLDYEQRREFRFSVLATYSKYSDICQVQVNVLNVNDNKPKFTQPQYSFHLTESRLRANLIGQVQAYDADLNDTIHYSLLETPNTGPSHACPTQADGQQLFELNPTTGQLSFRLSTMSPQELQNVSDCKLLVQATDSLGPPAKRHTQQARVNLHLAPQIIGRSVNFDHHNQQASLLSGQQVISSTWDQLGGLNRSDGSAANNDTGGQRSRTAASPTTASQRRQIVATNLEFRQGHQLIKKLQADSRANHLVNSLEATPQPSSQRSSLATVMSSFQHMMRSVNFLDMPVSSALLLSALLAFLVCLLLIVVVSMSFHVYRRHSVKSRRRRQIAAAAHLRHAHLAAAIQGSAGIPHAPSPATSTTINTSQAGNQVRSDGSLDSLGMPTNASTGNLVGGQDEAPATGIHQYAIKSAASQAIIRCSDNKQQGDQLVTNNQQSAQLTVVVEEGQDLGANIDVNNSERRHHQLEIRPPTSSVGSSSSPMSSHQSKRSYRSSLTNDTSTTSDDNCGHYSVTGTLQETKRGCNGSANESSLGRLWKDNSPTSNGRIQGRPANGGNARSSSVEAAIKSLVRQNGQELEQDISVGCMSDSLIKSTTRDGYRYPSDSRINRMSTSQIGAIKVSTTSKSEAETFRRLPLMNSPARQPINKVSHDLVGRLRSNRVAPVETANPEGRILHDSALGSSNNSSTSSSASSNQASGSGNSGDHNNNFKSSRNGGLMAMVRESVEASATTTSSVDNIDDVSARAHIRWPAGAFPQKVKKLTWDDELSSCNDEEENGLCDLGVRISSIGTDNEQFLSNARDCFIADDISLSGPLSPLGRHHKLPILRCESGERNNRLFLFTSSVAGSPLSPVMTGGAHGNPAMSHCGGNNTANGADYLDQSSRSWQNNGQSFTDDHSTPQPITSQNNCLDYTIVQNSQFQVMDSLLTTGDYPHQPPPPLAPMDCRRYMEAQQGYNSALPSVEQSGTTRSYGGQNSHVDKNDNVNYVDVRTITQNGGDRNNLPFNVNHVLQDLRPMTTAVL